MKVYYDLHIHSALSPCGDSDMTPNNIVNMSIIKGLDMIALTDHNSCGNVRAVLEVAKNSESGLLVIPGMEVETAEEVHVVCYFRTVEAAEKMQEIVKESLPPVKNKPEIFGNQYFMDAEDEIIGEEETLLVNATTMDIYKVFETVKNLGGVCVPAHIDRTSYSVISNLGFLPPDIDFKTIEITKQNFENMQKDYPEYNILINSDAHYLENISEKENFIEMTDKTIDNFFDFL